MTDRELMQQALDTLEDSHQNINPQRRYADELTRQIGDAITALRERLVQPEQTLTCVCGAVWEGELMVHAPRNRLAQPEQEPVAWMYEWDAKKHLTFTDQRFVEQAHPHFNKSTPLYTTPPQRPWFGLTEPELHEINPTWPAPGQHWDYENVLDFVRAIEVKLKEKNT